MDGEQGRLLRTRRAVASVAAGAVMAVGASAAVASRVGADGDALMAVSHMVARLVGESRP